MYRFLFPISLFFSASLLFIIQPMVAKILLPIYGGTPAVWTVCMLFFQILLLVAYAYAWFLSKFIGARWWRLIHCIVCLASLSVLPLAFVPISGQGIPELLILKNLVLQLGFPLLVVGTSAPLLQYAFSQTAGKRAADPYFLYVASNVGSLLALLSYPWLIERYSGVNQQFYVWNIIYIVYLVLLIGVLFIVRYEQIAPMVVKHNKIAWRSCATWIFLSFIPCSLMLGVTFYISTDIAATPLFWVLSLALYLLSFVVTFASNPIISHAWVTRNTLLILVFPILCFIIGINRLHVLPLMIANLLGFFMVALFCHGELVRTRPNTQQLTTFYFCLAFGGVIAGLFNGLLAPRLFVHAYEYPLVMLMVLLYIPIKKSLGGYWRWEWFIPSMVLIILLLNYYLPEGVNVHWLHAYHVAELLVLCLIVTCSRSSRSLFVGMGILFIFVLMPWFKPAHILSQQRNFYGVKQVFLNAGAHVLMSHSTVHGFQVLQGETTNGAIGYYGPILPVVQRLQTLHQPLHAMVLGLGTGMMACQFREKDSLTIVEIDEQIIDIANNPDLFTYLRDCPPDTELVKDDGRMAVACVPDASLELLVLDAFNSDAIPVHLLTLEALTLYKQKLTQDGVIIVNVTNRHLRVLPVLTGAGRKLDMIVLHKAQAGNNRLGQLTSEWVILTTNEYLAGSLLAQQGGWRFVTEDATQLWTNDYSTVISLLK